MRSTVLAVAQQVAADGRRIQVGGVEVDEGFAGSLRRGLVDALGLGALERLVDLPAGQVQAADRTVAGEFAPAGRLVDVLAHAGGLRPGARAGVDQPQRHGHLMGGAHDDLVDHHHRDGRAGHRIDGHRIAVAGTTDHHALIGLDAGVMRVEVVDLLLGDTDQQDRLVVLEHVGVLDRPLRIEQHLQVDRLAGVGRNVGDVDGLEGIAEDLVTLAQGADLVVALGLGDALGIGEELLDTLLLGLVHRGLCWQHRSHHGQENDEAFSP